MRERARHYHNGHVAYYGIYLRSELRNETMLVHYPYIGGTVKDQFVFIKISTIYTLLPNYEFLVYFPLCIDPSIRNTQPMLANIVFAISLYICKHWSLTNSPGYLITLYVSTNPFLVFHNYIYVY